MSRALLILNSQADRQKAIHWIQQAKPHTRVEFKAHKRSTDQNSKMWAMLTEVAEQATHMGQRYTPDQWKILFMYACGREVQFLPGLDGKTFLPWGQSTSNLSKEEMTDLIEFIFAWGAENDITFRDPQNSPDDEHQSDASSSPDASDTPAESALPGEEGDDTTRTQTMSSPSPIHECAVKILGIAVDPLFETPQQRRAALEQSKNNWKETLPSDDHDKLKSLVMAADAVIKGNQEYAVAVEFFSEQLGMAIDQFMKDGK